MPLVACIQVSPFPPSDNRHQLCSKGDRGNYSHEEHENGLAAIYSSREQVFVCFCQQRERQVERLKSEIFTLGCNQRRAALKHLKEDRLKKFEYCLPYFYNPFIEEEIEQSTVVDVLFPINPKQVLCEFDWELDELEAREARKKAREELSEEKKAAFENMKFYKFYPVASPDSPDTSNVKEDQLSLWQIYVYEQLLTGFCIWRLRYIWRLR